MRQPFRLYKDMINSIVLSIWEDPAITKKSQVKDLMTGDLTQLSSITDYPVSELQALLKDWNINTTRAIKNAWQQLNDSNVIDPASDIFVANAITAYASNHGISPDTALDKLEAAVIRAKEARNG